MGDPALNDGEIPQVQTDQLPGSEDGNHASAVVIKPVIPAI